VEAQAKTTQQLVDQVDLAVAGLVQQVVQMEILEQITLAVAAVAGLKVLQVEMVVLVLSF
jgi:hypothetical protein